MTTYNDLLYAVYLAAAAPKTGSFDDLRSVYPNISTDQQTAISLFGYPLQQALYNYYLLLNSNSLLIDNTQVYVDGNPIVIS